MPKTAKVPLRIPIKPADGRPGSPPDNYYREGCLVFNADDGILYLQNPDGSWHDFPADLVKASEASAIAGNSENKYMDGALVHAAIKHFFVGMICPFPSIVAPDGWIEADSSLLLRSDYPKLWSFAQNSGILVSDADWFANPSVNMGKFSKGDEINTFRLPLLEGIFVRSYDPNRLKDTDVRDVGSYQEDATQKIIGQFKVRGGSGGLDSMSGVFYKSGNGTYPSANGGSGGGYAVFDNSRVARTANEEIVKNVSYPLCIFHGES